MREEQTYAMIYTLFRYAREIDARVGFHQWALATTLREFRVATLSELLALDESARRQIAVRARRNLHRERGASEAGPRLVSARLPVGARYGPGFRPGAAG